MKLPFSWHRETLKLVASKERIGKVCLLREDVRHF